MEVVEDFEFAPRGNSGKYRQLYKDFLALPHGTAVRFTRPEDFEVEPAKFAVSLRTGLWNKGFRSRVVVREDGVYAQVVGPKADKDSDDEEGA
jgi:hypothetical protein